MKRFFLITALLFCSISNLKAEPVSLNPGIKIGYAFGKDAGFVFGIEISITKFSDDGNLPIYGFVLSADDLGDNYKIHAGFELSLLYLGIDVGPTITFADSESYWGLGTTFYSGFVLMPFLNYDINSGIENKWQTGVNIKAPINISKEGYDFN